MFQSSSTSLAPPQHSPQPQPSLTSSP